uniref:Peptidase A2 domain-containing protein n=1 Tax=Pygocentrus nattereri TaxID=42514 RepID=A0AAR2JZ36_PYGNA
MESSSNSNPVVSRPAFMPEVFDGVSCTWPDWLGQFELASELNGWDDNLRVKFMTLLLKGKAREVFLGLPSEARTVYRQLKMHLEKYLTPPANEEVERLNFQKSAGMGFYIHGKVLEQPARCLIDTGAQVSLLSSTFLSDLRVNALAELQTYKGKVRVANGALLDILGTWEGPCVFDGLRVKHVFLVCRDINQSVLLGTDFLSKFGAIIDLKANTCSLLGKNLPLVGAFGRGEMPHPLEWSQEECLSISRMR